MNKLHLSGKIRVCFPFVGDSVGGSHISAAQLIQNIDRNQFEPIVILHKDGPLCHFFDKENISYKLLEIPCFAGTTPKISNIAVAIGRTAPTLYKFVRENHIDIVHSNDLRMNLTWPFPTRMAARCFIWHQRLVISTSPLLKLLCAASNHIISISKTVRDTLPTFGHEHATIVPDPFTRYAPIPHEEAKARLLSDLGVEYPATVVGFVGNMTHQKRPLIFVKAAKILAKNPSKMIFIMAGDDRGGELSDAQLYAENLGIRKSIHFIGHRQPIEPWLSGFDVLLAPAVNEGYGRAVIEALLCGTPVVASNSGGHAEIITQRKLGHLVPIDNPNGFSAAAQELLDQRARVSEAEQTRVAEHHSPENHAKRIQVIYDTLTHR